jgi:hypothetical protein
MYPGRGWKALGVMVAMLLSCYVRVILGSCGEEDEALLGGCCKEASPPPPNHNALPTPGIT